MNPPFERGAAPKHVRHAYRFVKPGGVLVSVVPANVRQHSHGSVEFHNWLHDLDHEWHDVEPGAFASARDSFRQTGVAVDLLVIRKPN